jgi:hypothetical protein
LSSLGETSKRREEWQSQALTKQGSSHRIVEMLAGKIATADAAWRLSLPRTDS